MSKSSSGQTRKRVTKNSFTTKSGQTIKVHRGLSDRVQAAHDNRARRRANRLATLPKNRTKRMLYRLEPKRLVQYWFSRDGLVMALKITGIGVAAGFVILIGLFAYFRKDLPKITNVSGNDFPGSITYYDRTGTTVLFQDYDAVKRVSVPGTSISPFMKNATIAIEDKNFFKHGAFDIRGLARAGFHDLFGHGGVTQGGSTITEQVVKLNANWTTNRTISRKVKELILAVELEREYSKNDILTGYLNVAPYGGVEYGVEAAARDYFGVDAKDVTLPQAAMLAAIPQSPSNYSPYSSPQFNPAASADNFNEKGLLNRQHYIIDQMVAQGYITAAQAADAKKVDILAQVHPLESKYNGIKAPYFVLAAKKELTAKYGAATVNRGGWKVITTLDMNLQNTAEQLVAKNISSVSRRTAGLADEQATVTEDVQTGQIVALVGGTDFNNPDHGKINYAAQSLIPPGSSFKPYDYATLIDNNNNVGAGSVLYDTLSPLPGYVCTDHSRPPPKGTGNCLTDYDFLQPGPLTLRYALGGSRNIPAVKAMLEAMPGDTSNGRVTSINKVISTASAMMANPYNPHAYQCYRPGADINNAAPSDVTQCYGAAAIGDGAFLHLDDHVNGLATLARLGVAIPHTYILKITDASDHTVDQFAQPAAQQVIKPDTAYIVDDMASDPNASYLPVGGFKFHRQANGWHFAIKTGTTNNGFDGLMTSWSTKYAVVSWVGNHTRNVNISSITGAAMEDLTGPLTRGMMEAAHTNVPAVNWTKPADIKSLPAFIVRNHIHYGDVEPSPSTDLFPAWYQAKSTSGGSITNDKVSGKVATSCTPDAAKDVQANSNVSSWNIDIFNGGSTGTGSGSVSGATPNSGTPDDVHNCGDAPPTISAPVLASPTCITASACTFTVTIQQGTHALNDPNYAQYPGTVTLLFNGQSVGSAAIPASACSGSPAVCSMQLGYTPTSAGQVNVTAQVSDSVLYQSTSGATSITVTDH